MQEQKKRKTRHLRQFKVGIVGANSREQNSISRILMVTQYRTRCYQLVGLDEKKPSTKYSVDIVIVCSKNPNVIRSWEDVLDVKEGNARPIVILAHPQMNIRGKYTLGTPINPSKLIKLLDQFTIRELNYLPEFEIGHESAELHDFAFSGIKILRDKNGSKSPLSDCSGNTQRRNALVVDDSLAVRRQMQLEFELLDDDLDLAEDAEQALEAIQNKKYDVVFLDVVMPGMDGYTACKKIKKNPLNRNTPVILLTSKSSSFDKIKGTLAGCDAYLVKPINHNEFTQAYQHNVIDNAQGVKHASQ